MKFYADQYLIASFWIVPSRKHVNLTMSMITPASEESYRLPVNDMTQVNRLLVDIIETNYAWTIWTASLWKGHLWFSPLPSAVALTLLNFYVVFSLPAKCSNQAVSTWLDSINEPFPLNRRIYEGSRTPIFSCTIRAPCLCSFGLLVHFLVHFLYY